MRGGEEKGGEEKGGEKVRGGEEKGGEKVRGGWAFYSAHLRDRSGGHLGMRLHTMDTQCTQRQMVHACSLSAEPE